MKNRHSKALVAVVVGTSSAVGLGAAVAWRVAVPAGAEPIGEFSGLRPSWFPTSLLLVLGSIVTALILSSFLVDGGLRIRSDRHRPRTGLFALLLVLGGALGTGAAGLWTLWPPQPVERWAEPEPSDGAPVYWERAIPGNEPGTVLNDIDMPTSEFGWTATVDDDASTPFRPTISHPWLAFPLGGAVVAVCLALPLSLRDLRLTVHRGTPTESAVDIGGDR